MARSSGISTSSVQRIWRAFGVPPHRTETFKLSTDPLFVDKVRDVVGLYMSPRRALQAAAENHHVSVRCP